MITFACLSPHAPIFLPTVGSTDDREKVKSTITALESLAPKLAASKPEIIIISSPHPDWGVEVPLHFLMTNYQVPIINEIISSNDQMKIKKLIENWSLKIGHSAIFPILTTLDSPKQHYRWGQKIAASLPRACRGAWIASGDMSHTLKPDGPYGFNPAGPEFDKKFIELLKKKNIEGILNLDESLVEQAGECGLRSFCMLLGALHKLEASWNPEILSYEGPFGVGYLVTNLKVYNPLEISSVSK